MEQLETPDPGLVAPAVRLPVQLPLSWGDAAAEAAQPPAPVLPREPLEPPAPTWMVGADAVRQQVIEVQTRRVKMVCISLLGLVLLALRYLDS